MAVKIMKCGLRQWTRSACWKAWCQCVSLAIAVLYSSSLLALVDFEKEFASNIVVGSKQIHIPGFPGAFNPSIIQFRDAYLLSFRIIPNRADNMTSYLGVILLNDEFEPIGSPRILNLRHGSNVKSRAEDARLVKIGDRLFAVYSDNRDLKITRGGFRVYVVEIEVYQGEIEVGDPEGLVQFEGQNPDLREKNWVPFDVNGEMNLIYSFEPYLVFRAPLDGTGKCETIVHNSTVPLDWQFGEIRGGTPAIRVGDSFLGFFHSSIRVASVHSNGNDMMHYFMGAYTFSPDAPFGVNAISEVPIVGDGFYSGEQFKGYWKPVRAVFPGGYVFDDKHIWVAYGKDDHQVWVAQLDRKALIDSLVPIM